MATAAVFADLTSTRPSPEAWSVDKAFQHMQNLSGSQLDADCVNVLIEERVEVESIMAQFTENPNG